MLRKILGDERVVRGLLQKRSQPLEGFEKPRKVAEGVTLAHFLLGRFYAVTSHQCACRGWLDGAFQMQMKFSLGEGVDSRGESSHPQISVGQSGAACVVPRCEPEGADVGRGIRELDRKST